MSAKMGSVIATFLICVVIKGGSKTNCAKGENFFSHWQLLPIEDSDRFNHKG